MCQKVRHRRREVGLGWAEPWMNQAFAGVAGLCKR